MPNSKSVAPVRIEVLLDGRRVAVAGIEAFGVLHATVMWVRRNPSSVTAKMRSDKEFDETHFLREICEFQLGGLDSVADKHLFWAKEALRPGSEVTIRVLPEGPYDAPSSASDDA